MTYRKVQDNSKYEKNGYATQSYCLNNSYILASQIFIIGAILKVLVVYLSDLRLNLEDMPKGGRSYEDERQYIERFAPNSFRIKKGFVPNMKVGVFSILFCRP